MGLIYLKHCQLKRNIDHTLLQEQAKQKLKTKMKKLRLHFNSVFSSQSVYWTPQTDGQLRHIFL